MGLTGGVEVEDDEKKAKLDEDVIEFLKKGSGTNAPRYTARLKTIANLQHKKRRAAAARRRSEQKIRDDQLNDKGSERADSSEEQRDVGKRRRETLKVSKTSKEPLDSCGCKPRRRRSRRRRSRRRRRSSRRRRRRSFSRRRRRRSCGRRRKYRRRRRC